jgi:hypothetical protein
VRYPLRALDKQATFLALSFMAAITARQCDYDSARRYAQEAAHLPVDGFTVIADVTSAYLLADEGDLAAAETVAATMLGRARHRRSGPCRRTLRQLPSMPVRIRAAPPGGVFLASLIGTRGSDISGLWPKSPDLNQNPNENVLTRQRATASHHQSARPLSFRMMILIFRNGRVDFTVAAA